MNPADDISMNGCVTGLGCIESSFLFQTCPSVTDYHNADLPALAVCLQYLIQTEVSNYVIYNCQLKAQIKYLNFKNI